MSFLVGTWRTKPILIGLVVHFALWWAHATWLWTRGYGVPIWWSAAVSVGAPIYLGALYLRSSSFWEWGAAGVLVSPALIGMVLTSVKKRLRWVVLLTHFVVILYWLISFVLIAQGA